MKFSIFADIHHYPEVFMGGTYEDLDFIEARAIKEGCSFVIQAGDFTHKPAAATDYIKRYNNFKIPTYHCLGNHDTDRTPLEETLKLYNMDKGYYFFDKEGYRFIICDTNYYLLDGQYIHYDMGNYYSQKGNLDWMPPSQIKWLEETINLSANPCVIISHQSFERCNGVKNREEVQKIINEANKKKPNSVIMCINGHYHRDNLRVIDNVLYFDLNSASFDWIDNPHDKYPESLSKEHAKASNTLIYNDPIHAVISLEGNKINILGMESSMFMGINREHTDNPVYDPAGRRVTPRVQSAKISLG
ncbi:MAG: metallophosphoesterase [Tissierellales bacterium]